LKCKQDLTQRRFTVDDIDMEEAQSQNLTAARSSNVLQMTAIRKLSLQSFKHTEFCPQELD
jgi:hypothetical protein